MPAVDGDSKSKRNLVRWDDDKDKQLLLSLQYVCANAGIRIPWDDVAKEMGPKFSGGACVQHLAKLRSRMEEEGLDVPPPLARGLVTSKPSSIYAKSGGTRKRKAPAANAEAEDTAEVEPNNSLNTPPPSKKRKSIKKEPGIKEESEGEMPELYDSDEDYMANSGRTSKVTKAKAKPRHKKIATKNNTRRLSDEAVNAASETPTPEISLTMRTRGNRVNYAQMDVPVVEEEGISVEASATDNPNDAAQALSVKTEESSIIAPNCGTVASQYTNPLAPKEETTEPMIDRQQMQAPGPYYPDFGGNYTNFPGFNPGFNFGQPTGQTLWSQPNIGMPAQQFMYRGQHQQQEKVNANGLADWFSEPIIQPQPVRPLIDDSQQCRAVRSFNTGFVDTMFSENTAPTTSSFKKTSFSDLKSAEISRNNSEGSINTQQSLKTVPQEGFQMHYDEEDDQPIPNTFAEMIDWDAIGRGEAQYKAENGY